MAGKAMTYREFMGKFRPTFPEAGWKFPGEMPGLYMATESGGVWIPEEPIEEEENE